MRNILIITPFFAPYSHAAVYRAHRFAKYLPRFGWKPYVLTVDRSYLYFIDSALLDDLPKDVEIIRARHIDLTYSGFKSIFKKPAAYNRPIKGLKASDLALKLKRQEKRNFIKKIADKLRDEVLFIPDRYIVWRLSALKEAKRLIDFEKIDVIYSTAMPFVPHLIAMKLKRRFKIPWLADFRDPGAGLEHARYHSWRFGSSIDGLIEKVVMKKADLVLTLSEDVKSLFLSKYNKSIEKKIACIRTGTDTEILQSAEPKKENRKFTIIFAGEFLKAYSKRFFELLKIIFEGQLFERGDIEVLIIGNIKANIYLEREIEKLGLSDVVRLVNYLSLKDYFSALLSADATLLPGVLKYTFPIKLTDYLFIEKPIIAFDVTDEARKILEKSGLGFFIPNDIENGIKKLLNLLRGKHKFNINEDYINQFSAFNQTKELADILGTFHSDRQRAD